MDYTVSDFLSSYAQGIRLIAGSGGLARTVSEVGILDYELVPGVKSSYLRNNFYEGQLVLTTFLYARDAPYLIVDAVKRLVAAGASGLAIKNVFHLEIPDAALRYANARNFPLMLFSGDTLYFDNVIIEVGLRVRELADSTYAQREIDGLLACRDDAAAVRGHALRLNPSLREELVAIYAQVEDGLTQATFASLEARYRASGLVDACNLLCAYDEGVLLVVSADTLSRADVRAAQALLASEVLCGEAVATGVSEIHQDRGELGDALLEALYAARIARRDQVEVVWYDELGILRAVLPHAAERGMRAYSEAIMGPLHDFDAENNAQLARTLAAYLSSGRSVDRAAGELATHPNTVRYRMGQVLQLTGLDWRRPQDMEQLSLAHVIELSRDIVRL